MRKSTRRTAQHSVRRSRDRDTTAGADGDVPGISLPGALRTGISGLGIYYPDDTETQRVGVKINLTVRPTIKGITEGRDELLEKAEQLIMGNKGNH